MKKSKKFYQNLNWNDCSQDMGEESIVDENERCDVITDDLFEDIF